jgi:hypothetical protein
MSVEFGFHGDSTTALYRKHPATHRLRRRLTQHDLVRGLPIHGQWFPVRAEIANLEMRVRITDELGWSCDVPEYGEVVELS